MKILHINGYFKLPNDFNGTIEEAIEEWIKYRKNKGFVGNKTGDEIITEDAIECIWDIFLDKIEEGKNWTGVIQTASYINNSWVEDSLQETLDI